MRVAVIGADCPEVLHHKSRARSDQNKMRPPRPGCSRLVSLCLVVSAPTWSKTISTALEWDCPTLCSIRSAGLARRRLSARNAALAVWALSRTPWRTLRVLLRLLGRWILPHFWIMPMWLRLGCERGSNAMESTNGGTCLYLPEMENLWFPLQGLRPEQAKLLLKNSISPLPLHKALVLLEAIDGHGDHQLRRYGRLALANALVHRIGNLKFGPEVGVGPIKEDAPVVDTWRDGMETIGRDLRLVRDQADVSARVLKADARGVDQLLAPSSVDAVITSPPYPNEKDYTRTTRLESVILGLIRDRRELRSMKQNLLRSNSRGVYKTDVDDREVAEHTEIQRIAADIEKRRVELGKTSGFERLYPRVTQLYFGGMARHFASLRPVLRTRGQARLCSWRPSVLSPSYDSHRTIACRYSPVVGL